MNRGKRASSARRIVLFQVEAVCRCFSVDGKADQAASGSAEFGVDGLEKLAVGVAEVLPEHDAA